LVLITQMYHDAHTHTHTQTFVIKL